MYFAPTLAVDISKFNRALLLPLFGYREDYSSLHHHHRFSDKHSFVLDLMEWWRYDSFLFFFLSTAVDNISWHYLKVVALIFVVFFGLLLFYIRRYPGNPNCHPCWSTNKGMEPHAKDPKFNGNQCNQCK